jgi:biopolymer transport protein ExbD
MARKARSYGKKDEGLQITSMMDMFTIVLVFLIKQMDTEGNLMTQADNLRLPFSTSKKISQEVALTVVVDVNHILVDGQQVSETEQVAEQDSLMVAPMLTVLEQKRGEEKAAAMARGEDPDESGSVIVQLDKNLEYDIMYKVMATCGYAGYNNIAFAIVQKISED